MSNQDNLTDATSLTQAELDVPAGVGQPAESKVGDLTLVELNSFLGKTFPTKEAALKSIKDTYDFVGKPKDPVVQPAQIDPNKYVSRSEFEEATFYAKHPEYETQKAIISALAAQSGKSPAEVVEMDVFKTLHSKVQVANEVEQSKSVLHSNPRLGQATDKITQAQEALKGGHFEQGASLVTKAVLEAYEN